MNTRHNTCQRAADSLPNKPFNQCLHSLLSICRTLLFRELAKLGHNRISFFACPDHSSSFQIVLSGFHSGNPCQSSRPFKFSTWSFSFFFFFLFLFYLPQPPFRDFNFGESFILVASSIVLFDYIGIDRTGELFSIHFRKYQGS